MSAHRQNYTPAPQPRPRHTWRGILAAFSVAATLAIITIAASQGAEQMGPAPRPVLTFEAVPTALAPIDGQTLAQIRVESFRAGYENAVQDGCTPGLTVPIAQARP